MPSYKEFETERLLLRPTTEADADYILKVMNTPKWLKFIGDRNIHSREDAQNYIKERISPQLARLGYANYTVIRKEDGAKIGSCGLYDREGLEGIDIGFAFLEAYEKKGYAYEAASEVMRAAIEEFGIAKISGITVKENLASQKLLEKLGLKFKEIIRMEGDSEELMLYVWEKSGS
ncbi:MAG: GNAT family N-acetyltransferase [Bacteroidota bacterium]